MRLIAPAVSSGIRNEPLVTLTISPVNLVNDRRRHDRAPVTDRDHVQAPVLLLEPTHHAGDRCRVGTDLSE